ncbi:MAG TPA: hypothetical protein VEI07_17625, partial [Planctomycetaceae bacterium]|nr:hypothetical protein [Planctomycetaceae bacterium]
MAKLAPARTLGFGVGVAFLLRLKTTVETVMHAGLTLTLRLTPPEIAKKVTKPTLSLFHEPFDSPSTFSNEPLSFDS